MLRQFKYYGSEEKFTLLELTKESDFSDDEFDRIADLHVGGHVEIEGVGIIERDIDVAIVGEVVVDPTDLVIGRGA